MRELTGACPDPANLHPARLGGRWLPRHRSCRRARAERGRLGLSHSPDLTAPSQQRPASAGAAAGRPRSEEGRRAHPPRLSPAPPSTAPWGLLTGWSHSLHEAQTRCLHRALVEDRPGTRTRVGLSSACPSLGVSGPTSGPGAQGQQLCPAHLTCCFLGVAVRGQ